MRQILVVAALAVGVGSAGAGCKKKKPQEPQKPQPVEPAAGPAAERPGAPVKGARPATAAGDAGMAARAGSGDAGAGAGTGAPGATAAPGAGASAGEPVWIPPSGAREAAAKAPTELVERGEVLIGIPEVGDGRDAEKVTSMIHRARNPITACHTRAIRANANLAGSTVFDLTIDQRGVVTSFTVDGSLDSELTECVANRLRGIRFGTAAGEVRVRVPIRFGSR